jgi:hypothetical protein
MTDREARSAAQIRERAAMMRWLEDVDTDSPAPGTLADVWWNEDVPFLLGLLDSAPRVSPDERSASAASRCVVGSDSSEVGAE